MKYTKCPVCKSHDLSLFIHVKGYRKSNEVFRIDECLNCSFKFTNPIPDESEIGEYYLSENYISHTSSKKGFFDVVYQLVRKYALRSKINLIQKHLNLEGSLVVDYGCGTGSFLEVLQNRNVSVKGFEPSSIAISNSSSNIRPFIYNPSEFIALSNKSVSVITLWHVFEHIYNFNEFLSNASQKLVDNGFLFIAVPNHESYDAEIYSENWAAWDVPIHHSHFNKKSMKLVLENNGLDLVDVVNMHFDSFYVSLLSEQLMCGSKNPIRALINGLRSNLRGFKSSNMSSLIYVAKNSRSAAV